MDTPPDRRLPYPVDVQRRDPDREPPLPASGVETFDTDGAHAINRARTSHLESLGLTLDGKAVLLLETIVCDHSQPVLALVDESVVSNQALGGLGCRPSPAYVTMALNRLGLSVAAAGLGL